MYIPDLFGSYLKGRQAAIGDNWKDLENYEKIEAARNKNDMDALEIVRERAKFGGDISMFYDNANESARNNQIADIAHEGRVALADMGRRDARHRWQAYLQNEGTITPYYSGAIQANMAKNNYLNEETIADYSSRNAYSNGLASALAYDTSTRTGAINANINYLTAQTLQDEANFNQTQQPTQHSVIGNENQLALFNSQHGINKVRQEELKARYATTPLGETQRQLQERYNKLTTLDKDLQGLKVIAQQPGMRDIYREEIANAESLRNALLSDLGDSLKQYDLLRGKLGDNSEFSGLTLSPTDYDHFYHYYNSYKPKADTTKTEEPHIPNPSAVPSAGGVTPPTPQGLLPPDKASLNGLGSANRPYLSSTPSIYQTMALKRIGEIEADLNTGRVRVLDPVTGNVSYTSDTSALALAREELRALRRAVYGSNENQQLYDYLQRGGI